MSFPAAGLQMLLTADDVDGQNTFKAKASATVPKVNALAVVEGPVRSIVRYDFAPTDLDTVGVYQGEFRRVGLQATVPGDSFVTINVIQGA